MACHTQTHQFLWGILWCLVVLHTHSHAAAPAPAVQGEWLCHTPSVQGATPQSHYVSIHQGVLQTNTIDVDMQLTPTGDGQYVGTWLGAPATQPPRQLT